MEIIRSSSCRRNKGPGLELVSQANHGVRSKAQLDVEGPTSKGIRNRSFAKSVLDAELSMEWKMEDGWKGRLAARATMECNTGGMDEAGLGIVER